MRYWGPDLGSAQTTGVILSQQLLPNIGHFPAGRDKESTQLFFVEKLIKSQAAVYIVSCVYIHCKCF